jgi:hypothetical protein
MTLIVVAGNSANTVMVSDRRLSEAGALVDDESNKAAVLFCADARLAVSFTGLAADYRARGMRGIAPPGRLRTEQWLLEALHEAATPDRAIRSIVQSFAHAASERWARIPGRIRVEDRGVAFLFAGYRYGSGGASPYWCLVSNFVDGGRSAKPDFAVDEGLDSSAYMFGAGAHRALVKSEMRNLGSLVESRRPANAIVGKAVEIIQQAADSPIASGTVGKQCTSIVVPAQPDAPVEQAYHTAVTTNTIHGVNQVDVREGRGISVMNPSITQDPRSPSEPVPPAFAVPKVGRNQPCPCGSGKKYKRCHGRR